MAASEDVQLDDAPSSLWLEAWRNFGLSKTENESEMKTDKKTGVDLHENHIPQVNG